MKRFLGNVCALALCLCLLAGTAFAGTASLESKLAGYFDQNDDVRMSMTFELKNLLPYGESAIGMLNGVLGHLRVNAEMRGQDTQLAFASDGETLFTLSDQQSQGLTTTLLPNRTLLSATGALDRLLGNGQQETPAFELTAAIAEAEACYQALTDAIKPFATEKKANYKIAGIGYAKWVRLAKLTAEQAAQVQPQLVALLGCGMDNAFRQQLATLACKNNFTIALYSTAEDGEDLSVYVKGNVSLGENDSRTLSYQWSFTRAEGKVKDAYKLELIRAKAPAERRLVAASSSQTGAAEEQTLALDTSVTLRTGARTEVTTEKQSLKLKQAGEKTSLSGKLSTTVKVTGDGDTTTTVQDLEPSLTLTSAEGSGVLSGSVKVTEKLNKNVTAELNILMDEDPAAALSSAAADGSLYAVGDGTGGVTITVGGSSLAQNADTAQTTASASTPAASPVGQPPLGMTAYTAPSVMETVDLDAASPEQLAALREEMSQNAAGLLLIAISKLPEEDRALLADNMTDQDFATLMELVSGL